MCIGIGLCADNAWQSAVGWLAHGSRAVTRAYLGVESRPHGVRISNLTPDRWSACVVTLDGGYSSPAVPLGPGRRATIPYVLFSNDDEMLSDVDGVGRAFRSTAVECGDARDQRSFAMMR
jgi:hypothetical protein